MIGWYFAEENKPKNTAVDKLVDSKFGIDKWNSFAREIIQNSIDVPDPEKKDENNNQLPINVCFSKKDIEINKIPGALRTKQILQHCLENDLLNQQTRNMYENSLKLFDNGKITCLKISDYNTLGVEPGLDKAWGAFVYDEGISFKRKPGSAGSHGVGKKAPFIISSLHNVFYCTKFEDKRLFEGKISLVGWTENGITYDYEGWFGNVNLDSSDRREKVTPIEDFSSLVKYDDFFYSRNERGTDVIIVGIDSSLIEVVKEKILNAVMENFFVAIENKNLECNVFGEAINKNTLPSIIDKYYKTTSKNFRKVLGYENLQDGNLKDYYKVYDHNPSTVFDLKHDDKLLGKAEVYFIKENSKNKKYYCLVREHGMKIKDIQVDAEQPFTAVVFIKDSKDQSISDREKINAIMAETENAAHDDFVINDEQYKCSDIAKKLIEEIYEKVDKYIKEQTKIDVQDEQYLGGVDEIMPIQGVVSKTVTRKSTVKKNNSKSKIKRKGLGEKAKDYEEGVTAHGGEKSKDKPGHGENKPAKPGNEFKATLFENFTIQPTFLHSGEYYYLKFTSNKAADKSYILINLISVDDKIMKLDNIIESAWIDDEELPVSDNKISNIKLKQGKPVTIKIRIKNNLDYALDCDIFVEAQNA